jgi:ankyrin repeat protein
MSEDHPTRLRPKATDGTARTLGCALVTALGTGVLLTTLWFTQSYWMDGLDTALAVNLEPSERAPESTVIHNALNSGTLESIRNHDLRVEDLNALLNGMTPIMSAASQGRAVDVKQLLSMGADPNKRGASERTALQYAVAGNHGETALALLAGGADIDAADNSGLTPLIMTADRGYTELGLELIAREANVNARMHNGWTALLDAAKYGNRRLATALVEAGAKLSATVDGQHASALARSAGHPDLAAYLAAP